MLTTFYRHVTFNSLFEMPKTAPPKPRRDPAEAFNSLFEMQVLEEVEPRRRVVVVLSILYLRCADDKFLLLTADKDFQFSI